MWKISPFPEKSQTIVRSVRERDDINNRGKSLRIIFILDRCRVVQSHPLLCPSRANLFRYHCAAVPVKWFIGSDAIPCHKCWTSPDQIWHLWINKKLIFDFRTIKPVVVYDGRILTHFDSFNEWINSLPILSRTCSTFYYFFLENCREIELSKLKCNFLSLLEFFRHLQSWHLIEDCGRTAEKSHFFLHVSTQPAQPATKTKEM